MLKTYVPEVNVGDIVLAKYYPFKDDEFSPAGEKKPRYGPFIVYSVDNYWLTNLKCFSAIKICSEPQSFQIEMAKERFPFLDHTSYINCSCQQRFRLDQVVKILGVADKNILNCVRKQLENYNKDVDKQLENAMNRYDLMAQAVQNQGIYLNSEEK